MKRMGQLKKVYLLPNLITTACLFAGFFSIIQSLQGNYVLAAWLIFIAGLCDGLDGRLARLTNSESAFGVEYDSLADLTSFGIAPGVLVYQWHLFGFGRFGVMVTFLYVACAALRLARYNVQVGRVEKNSFQGLPVPMAAGVLCTWPIFYHYLEMDWSFAPTASLIATFCAAILMVTLLRYRSVKDVHFRSKTSFYFVVGGVVFFFVMALEPAVTVFVCAIGYILSGPLEALLFPRSRREFAARVAASKQVESDPPLKLSTKQKH